MEYKKSLSSPVEIAYGHASLNDHSFHQQRAMLPIVMGITGGYLPTLFWNVQPCTSCSHLSIHLNLFIPPQGTKKGPFSRGDSFSSFGLGPHMFVSDGHWITLEKQDKRKCHERFHCRFCHCTLLISGTLFSTLNIHVGI